MESVIDIQVDENTDIRWQELAEQTLGPEDFLSQCGSNGTSYSPTLDPCSGGEWQTGDDG